MEIIIERLSIYIHFSVAIVSMSMIKLKTICVKCNWICFISRRITYSGERVRRVKKYEIGNACENMYRKIYKRSIRWTNTLHHKNLGQYVFRAELFYFRLFMHKCTMLSSPKDSSSEQRVICKRIRACKTHSSHTHKLPQLYQFMKSSNGDLFLKRYNNKHAVIYIMLAFFGIEALAHTYSFSWNLFECIIYYMKI